MSPRPNRSPALQRGVSVLAAVFFLLLFGLLAALMANVISVTHSTAAEDVLGARAYQAARGGAEWGLYQVLDPTNATATGPTAALPTCFAATSVPGLGATVSVSCAASVSYTEGSKSIRIYRITSTATIPGPAGLTVERSIEVTTEKCRDTASTVAPFGC